MTWGTLNVKIKMNSQSAATISEFNFDNKIYKGKQVIANVNYVGPKLAKYI